jgi:hypothetical protein
VSAASGGALKRKIGGIEHRCVDPPVMMLAISVRFYASVFGCGSALERTVVALEHTALAPVCRQRIRQKLQIKPKIINKTKKKRNLSFLFFLFIFIFIRNRNKIKINCRKNKILIITSRKIKSI